VTAHPPKKIVVLGPSHHARRSYACTLQADDYRTPLGTVPLDGESVQRMSAAAHGLLRVDRSVFQREHSVDVQVPFIQEAAPDAKLVPIVVPWLPRERLRALAEVLYQRFSGMPDVLIVASSDLSPFFPDQQAKQLDGDILDELRSRDVNALLAAHDKRRGPCGLAPIVVLLDYIAHMKDVRVTRLDVATSADAVPSTAGRVVGYAAVAMTSASATRRSK
jgi:AmmeMemoRadiSam system protein B